MSDHVELIKAIERLTTVTEHLEKRLYGNGQPGDIQKIEERLDIQSTRLDSHDDTRSRVKGAIGVITTLLTIFGASLASHLFWGKR